MLNFSNVPENLDKNYIFNRISEEDIFSFYGIPIKDGRFCSPLRNDRRPTCNFYRSRVNKLKYRDWGANHHFDAIGFVQWKFGLSFPQALFRVWEDMIHGNPSLPSHIGDTVLIGQKEPSRIRVKRKAFTTTDAQWWSTFGISLDILRKYRVAPIERAWLNDESHYVYRANDPCYGYHLGYEEYKLYFPYRDKFRFLSSTSRIQGWSQLPATADKLVITKSLKDVMLLHRYQIAAIALHSESQVPTVKLIGALRARFQDIVVFYDNDKPGILAMQQAKEHLPCMWMPRGPEEPKDITDYYAVYGNQRTIELINYAINKLNTWKSGR